MTSLIKYDHVLKNHSLHRLKEVEAMSELKELRLKIMDLETQSQVSNNQLKRKGDEVKRLAESLEDCRKREAEVQTELRESQRRWDMTLFEATMW